MIRPIIMPRRRTPIDRQSILRKEIELRSILSILALVLLVVASVPSDGLAEEQPIQLSLFNPLQIRPEDTAIKYFRFNLIYGKNTSLVGLDLGLVNHLTAGESKSLQINQRQFRNTSLKQRRNLALDMIKQSLIGNVITLAFDLIR